LILRYPDPRLRKVSTPVTTVTPGVLLRAQQLTAELAESRGIGLAAPQIGWSARVIAVNVTRKPEDLLVVLNPTIFSRTGGSCVEVEACLSLPGITGKVKRSKGIVVHGQTLDGDPVEFACSGLAARCIAHEIDHLNGILFIDRLSPTRKQTIKRKLRKLGGSPK